MRLPDKAIPILIFSLCLLLLVLTLSPALFNLDSVELTIGAKTLGIVHAPGYPLYLLVAHGFTYLPVGDIAYRVNLLSAVMLAGTAPLLYATLYRLIQQRAIAVAATGMFMWSYFVWIAGVVAEIYTAQVFSLVLCLWCVVRLWQKQSQGEAIQKAAWLTGLAFGVAIAFSPSSLLFAPALAVSLLAMRLPLRYCVQAGLLSLLVLGLSLLYFPLSYAHDPLLNMAGYYGADGKLVTINLQSVEGILWMVRGEQFSGLMFRDGYLPSQDQLARFGGWFWSNWLGIGMVLGGVGLFYLAKHSLSLLALWGLWTLPFTYFYLCYGAPDRYMMLSPLYALWTLPLAWGLKELLVPWGAKPTYAISLLLPLIFLGINYPLVDLSEDREVYQDAQARLDQLPPDAIVMGEWWDVLPLQYLQIIEGQRSDLKLYNTFLFYGSDDIDQFVATFSCQQTFVLVGERVPGYPDLTKTHRVISIEAEDGTLWYARAIPLRCLSLLG